MKFHNVTVDKVSNIYFDGNVTSRNITCSDGSIKTLGVMLKGEYEFNTSKKEIMEITSGELDVLLPKSNNWQLYTDNNSFEVPANSSFKVRVHKITNYCCSYVD
tara:strand:+ start:3046 stop:3357 length:312 start_codon:yes stop_codon:yes gene_type:complete